MLQYLYLVGLLIILHAGFSAVHYRHFAQGVGVAVKPHEVPTDVKLEVALGFILALVGVLLAAGPLKPIKYSTQMNGKKYDSLSDKDSFRVFNHRGAFLAKRLATARR